MEQQVQKIDHGYDPLLMAAVMALAAIGLGLVGSAVFGTAITPAQVAHATRMLNKQLLAFAIGMALFFLILVPRWDFLYTTQDRVRRLINLSTIGGIVILAGLLFLGKNAGGANRWYNLGPISVQPGEFFKVVFIIFIAYHVGRMQEFISRSPVYIIKPAIVLLVADAILFKLPDRGSMIQLTILSVVILVLARIRLKHLFIALMITGIMVMVVIYFSDNLLARTLSWLFPEYFAKGAAYQVVMASTMVNAGGTWGAGLGKGILGGLHWLPEQQNDYIVAVLMEDLGLAGLFVVIGLYLTILWRSVLLASRLKSPLHRYVVFGLGMLIVSQAVINLGVALNMFPSKGATLPFISYGGSSMVAFMAAIGAIEWMHRYARRVDE